MLGPLAGALKSGPWWTLTYQPPDGIEYSAGTVLVTVAAPEESAMTWLKAYAIPPFLAQEPVWT